MSQDTADRIGKFYDSVTDPYIRAWNGNLHMGYVDSEIAPVSVETATERLTAEVLDRLRVEPGATVLVRHHRVPVRGQGRHHRERTAAAPGRHTAAAHHDDGGRDRVGRPLTAGLTR